MTDIMQLLNRESWTERAKCLDEDADAFFPATTASDRTAEAKAACAECPVQAQCLDYGRTEKYGIWGGLDEHERRALNRRRHA